MFEGDNGSIGIFENLGSVSVMSQQNQVKQRRGKTQNMMCRSNSSTNLDRWTEFAETVGNLRFSTDKRGITSEPIAFLL